MNSLRESLRLSNKLKEFWKQLAWPDIAGSQVFILSIVKAITSGTVLYCNLSYKRVKACPTYTKVGDFEVPEKALTAVNNMEHVLQDLHSLPSDLQTELVLQAYEQSKGHQAAEESHNKLKARLNGAESNAMAKINSIIDSITEQMRSTVKKFVFHLAWAPEKLSPEKALSPLIEYLEKNLKSMYTSFLEANFLRVLESMWKVVLDEIASTVRANIGKERPYFFERFSSSLSILSDFFHADGKALPVANIHNPTYMDLEQELKLHKSETSHLVELYYQQRLEDQSKLFHAPFGCLTVNIYYDEVKQCICIEVLSARDLIPCDPNGLSDPFVILELVPRHMFPGSIVCKTKVHKKTLNPYFNEYYEWPAKIELCRENTSALSLVVMDHDYMRKNDFEGEAYVPLSSLPGVDSSKYYDGTPIELVLMQAQEKNIILNTLAVRTWDKDAMDLLKQEKIKRS